MRGVLPFDLASPGPPLETRAACAYLLPMRLIPALLASLGLLPAAAAPAAPGDCVVLLHGLARTPASMLVMEEALAGIGYEVVNRGYPSTTATVVDATRIRVTTVDQNNPPVPSLSRGSTSSKSPGNSGIGMRCGTPSQLRKYCP